MDPHMLEWFVLLEFVTCILELNIYFRYICTGNE